MNFKVIQKNDPLLKNFTDQCSKLGYENNSSIDKLKFDYFDFCRYIGGVEKNKIYLLSGVHNFDFDNQRFYRIGFRGVSLNPPNIPLTLSSNYRISSLNVGVIFYLLMRLTESFFGSCKFIITTNDIELSHETAGKSHLSDKLFKSGRVSGLSLLYEKIEYLHTVQNVWLVNQEEWKKDFEYYHKNKAVLDSELKKILEE